MEVKEYVGYVVKEEIMEEKVILYGEFRRWDPTPTVIFLKRKFTTVLADTAVSDDTGDRVSATLPKDTGRFLPRRAFSSLFHAGADTGRVT